MKHKKTAYLIHLLDRVKFKKSNRIIEVIPNTTIPVNKLMMYKKAMSQTKTLAHTTLFKVFFSLKKK